MSDYDYSSKMQEIRQSNAQTISQYFSQLPAASTVGQKSEASSPFSGVISSLGDYGLMRSGSYTKLMKAYYNNLTEANADTVTDSTSSLVLSKSDAKSLKVAADGLNNSSFDKVTKTTKDEETGKETTTTDYDWDTLYKNASEFVKSYNAVIDSVSELSSSAVLKTAVRMVNQTASSSDLLKDIGIRINNDNTLSIDEEIFKKADVNKIKTLFKGQNSYASKVATKATAIYNMSANAALTQATGGSRIYTQAGNYSDITTSTLYDSLL